MHAVDGVSFSIAPGELLGLVGESGSGKIDGRELRHPAGRADGGHDPAAKATTSRTLSRRKLRPLVVTMHMVFQDPYSSLNPRLTCGADRR